MKEILLRIAIFSSLLLLCASTGGADDRALARDLYQKTQYKEVLRLLETGKENDPSTYELIGKAHYHLRDYKKATQAFEKAVAADPVNSNYHDWLGKAYGRRAETSSFVTAWAYAGKCRRYFERAIELNPANIEAIDDLFEYQINAPSIVGGGLEKAAQTAELVRDLNPAKYHELQARLADKQKDFPREESHLRKALELAPRQLGRILDLAEFLARRKRFPESEAMFNRAKEVAPDNAELKFERAKTLIESGRNRDEASKLLQEYLNTALTPDDPPRAEAEELLRKISG
ncbi:MAG: tetratricopeptide repeat protein [Acidobacteria bacterium]|nr:tetratricopeptide repeat protein [Acidobacteriota bacterium]